MTTTISEKIAILKLRLNDLEKIDKQGGYDKPIALSNAMSNVELAYDAIKKEMISKSVKK